MTVSFVSTEIENIRRELCGWEKFDRFFFPQAAGDYSSLPVPEPAIGGFNMPVVLPANISVHDIIQRMRAEYPVAVSSQDLDHLELARQPSFPASVVLLNNFADLNHRSIGKLPKMRWIMLPELLRLDLYSWWLGQRHFVRGWDVCVGSPGECGSFPEVRLNESSLMIGTRRSDAVLPGGRAWYVST